MIAARLIVLIMPFCIVLSADAQIPEMNNVWGVDVAVPYLANAYRAVDVSVWHTIRDKRFVSLELGYGWPGLNGPDVDLDPLFQQSYRKFYASPQYFFTWYRIWMSHLYVGVGPYFETMTGVVDTNYFFNANEALTTVHSGAKYNMWRLGMQGSAGGTLLAGPVSFGLRIHIPIFYEKSRFTNISEPLTFKDFEPPETSEYQEKISTIRSRPTLSFRIGITLNRPKR